MAGYTLLFSTPDVHIMKCWSAMVIICNLEMIAAYQYHALNLVDLGIHSTPIFCRLALNSGMKLWSESFVKTD